MSIEKYLDLDVLFNDRNYLINSLLKLYSDYNSINKFRDKYERMYLPFDIKFSNGLKNFKAEEYIQKSIDKNYWGMLIQKFNLKVYMLCTDYEKLIDQVYYKFEFPAFDKENATGWIRNLKDMVYQNVEKLFKDVFNRVMNETYKTGGWNSPKKKRNNNGIDSHFIISTGDYNMIFDYYSNKPTITDDLEKVSYLMFNEKLPDKNFKDKCQQQRISEIGNEWLKIKMCKNGNTHYYLNEEFRTKLNLLGSGRSNIIGENIRIKIFE